MNKKLLVVQACDDVVADEVKNIVSQASLYGIKTQCEPVLSSQEMSRVLRSGERYDYVYLATHGNDQSFGTQDSSKFCMSWMDFSVEICMSLCTNDDAIFMHSCCRGGLHQVAYTMFGCCPRISYVCGPRQSLLPHELVIGFNIFLFNVFARRMDPIVATDKITKATDLRFQCFDRLEAEADPIYADFVSSCQVALNKIAYGKP